MEREKTCPVGGLMDSYILYLVMERDGLSVGSQTDELWTETHNRATPEQIKEFILRVQSVFESPLASK